MTRLVLLAISPPEEPYGAIAIAKSLKETGIRQVSKVTQQRKKASSSILCIRPRWSRQIFETLRPCCRPWPALAVLFEDGLYMAVESFALEWNIDVLNPTIQDLPPCSRDFSLQPFGSAQLVGLETFARPRCVCSGNWDYAAGPCSKS